MTELEKLRKHVAWFRAFGKQMKAVLTDADGGNNKQRVANAAGILRTFENQWPNWLDDDIESMTDEESV